MLSMFAAAGCAPDSEVAGSGFVDITRRSGIDFVHAAALGDTRYLPQIIGPGVALLDYDGDGDLDVYLVQGGDVIDRLQSGDTNQLYRNEFVPTGRLEFVDVTQSAGVGDTRFGMGVAAGDLDNDGDVDLLVTNFLRDTLYRNNGDATFTDVTPASGLGFSGWSTSASMADYDGDGLLDIFVTHYVDDSITQHRDCDNTLGTVDYCSPTVYPATTDSLYRNEGGLKFSDVSAAAGLDQSAGAGLGVVATDFDGDAKLDFFVANDQSANFLWRNNGDGTFDELGLIAGCAYNGHGMAEASMGIAAQDFDADGDDDLFVTHLTSQTNTLYINDGRGSFRDATDQAQLGSSSIALTGFGVRWFDQDNDSDLDLFVANGSVFAEAQRVGKSDFPYEQRNQLYVLEHGHRYREVEDPASGPLQHLAASRGASFGDLDNDGDIDIVVANAQSRPQVLRNEQGGSAHWLGLSLRDPKHDRHAIGARVAFMRPGEKTLWRRVARDGSYLSSSDPRVHLGLGNATGPVTVGVVWPDGSRELWPDLTPDDYVSLNKGQGRPWTEGLQSQ